MELGEKTWTSATIHFHFSIPVTWNLDTVKDFEAIIVEAGFASRPSFHVFVDLTEPHAVAAYTIVEEPGVVKVREFAMSALACTVCWLADLSRPQKKDESVLIVDIGGGTVVRHPVKLCADLMTDWHTTQDLCFVTIEDAEKGCVKMTEVKAVQGHESGATFIDEQFQHLLQKPLNELDRKDLLHFPVDYTAFEMRNSDSFQTNKRRFGLQPVDDNEIFNVKVPGLKELNDEECGLRRGEMQILWYGFLNGTIEIITSNAASTLAVPN